MAERKPPHISIKQVVGEHQDGKNREVNDPIEPKEKGHQDKSATDDGHIPKNDSPFIRGNGNEIHFQSSLPAING
jgi:hypothetical protein